LEFLEYQWNGVLIFRTLNENRIYGTFDIAGLCFQREQLSCFDMGKNGRVLSIGYDSCLVRIFNIKLYNDIQPTKKTSTKETLQKPQSDVCLTVTLEGHSLPVKCIVVSSEFSLILSGSYDRTCIIWDSNRFSFVRSLEGHKGPVVAISIHPYNGDIYTVDIADNKSTIYLWSINGEKITEAISDDVISAITVSSLKPGISENCLVTGHINGIINIWSASNLQPTKTIISNHKKAITSLCFNVKNTSFTSGDEEGNLIEHSIKHL